ncbi:MAG TPA: hypothetical protein PLY93_03815 [Turneriella sp.]|nr:hypothetical protein [Turneriella sp.]
MLKKVTFRNSVLFIFLWIFSSGCSNIGFVDDAVRVAEGKFGIEVFVTGGVATGGYLATPGAYTVNCNGQTGVAKADCICQDEANNRQFTGTYRAWLSTSGVDAICNIQGRREAACSAKASMGPFVMRTQNGMRILANDYSELSSVGMRIPLDPLASMVNIWTGSTAAGRATMDNCNDWTMGTTSIKGTVGDKSKIGTAFTDTGAVLGCDQQGSLLCMRQVE